MQNENTRVAWLSARLSTYYPERARDFTKLDSLLMRDHETPVRRAPWQEQLARVQAWASRSKRAS